MHDRCSNCGLPVSTRHRCFLCGRDCCGSCSGIRYTTSGRPQTVHVCNRCGYQSDPRLR